MRLMRKMGFSEYQDGDFRLVAGTNPAGEVPAQVVQPRQPPKLTPDPESAADLVLFPPELPQDN